MAMLTRSAEVDQKFQLTAMELLAKSPEEFYELDAGHPGQPQPPRPPGPRPLTSTPTQRRTFDPVNNRPDTVPDINQE